MLSRLFIAALWSPFGKELTSWLLFVIFNCIFVTFPCGILGQMWYLIVSIPDLCRLSLYDVKTTSTFTKNKKKTQCMLITFYSTNDNQNKTIFILSTVIFIIQNPRLQNCFFFMLKLTEHEVSTAHKN